MKLTKRSMLDATWNFSFAFWFVAESIFAHSTVAVVALVFFWALTFERIIRQGSFKPRIPGLFILYATFILVCYMNIWLGYSINEALSRQLCTTLWRNFIFIISAYYYVTNVEMKDLKKNFVIAVMVGSIFALVASFITTGSFMLRGEESFFNANFLAISAAIAICFIVCSDNFKMSPKNTFCLLILGLLCVFSGTRKALLAAAIIIVVYIVLKNPQKLLKSTLIIFIALIAVYIALMNVPFLYETIGNRIESMFSLLMGDGGDASAESRSEFIELGLKYFPLSPWLGNGINCFQTLPGAYGTYSHNNYIELLFGVGILGVAAYYSMFLLALYKAQRQYFKDRRSNTVLCIGMIIALLFIDIALVSYYERTNLTLLIICYGLLKNKNSEGEKV